MDKESAWILKQLSMQEISAVSADRILRALAFLRRKEQGKIVGFPATEKDDLAVEMPQMTEETTLAVEGLLSIDSGKDESTTHIKAFDGDEETKEKDAETIEDQDNAIAESISETDETHQEAQNLFIDDTFPFR